MTTEAKTCIRCCEAKSLDSFGADRRARDGKLSTCRLCTNADRAAWRAKNPDKRREYVRKSQTREKTLPRRYGITADDYRALLDKQGGGCAICGGPPTGTRGAQSQFHVDHDHSCCPGRDSCGRCVRGLLCGNCNVMLGMAKDDPERLRAAINYLKGH